MKQKMPLLGISGYSGCGKTTLLEKLLPHLNRLGLRVSVIKHSHHNAHVDKEGKDSWRMKEAGSKQVIMVCDNRWALMTETSSPTDLYYLSEQFDSTLTDLVLVEGFKHEPIPKILLHRREMTKSLPEIDPNVVALATNYFIKTDRTLLDLNNIDEIAQFVYRWFTRHKREYYEPRR